MKTIALGIALMLGGTALAQTPTQDQMPTGSDTTAQTQTGWNGSASGQTSMAMNSTGPIVQPSNANPRRDERGIRVISLPAVVPAGWNGTPDSGTGTGGPLLDPTTGQPVSDTGSAQPCSRTVTDKCVQTYERGRRR